MAQGNITPLYGLWLKENLSLYQFHSMEAKKLEDSIINLDTDKAESGQKLIELYSSFLSMFCNSMHSVALGINEKDITSNNTKAYLVENEYGVMTPIALMEASKKKAEYSIEGSVQAALQKQSEIDEGVKGFANQNKAVIEACNTYPVSNVPKRSVILITALMIATAFAGIVVNRDNIIQDMYTRYFIYFWACISLILIIYLLLTLRELKCLVKWRKYKADINWLGEYLKKVSNGQSEATELIWATTASIKNAIASNMQELPIRVGRLPDLKVKVDCKKEAIINMTRRFKKSGRRLHLWGLLILLLLNVFLFYGTTRWDYRAFLSMEFLTKDGTVNDNQNMPTQAITHAPTQKPVDYQLVTVKSSKATSELTGKKTGTVYDSSLTLDGDIKTCWQEGADGDGIGEKITYYFRGIHPLMNVKIWNGKLDNKHNYEANNRIKELEIICYKSEDKVYDTIVALKDEYDDKGYTITLNGDIAIDSDRVVIKVISVYNGSDYSDTCLSDIEFYEGVY